VTALDTGDAAAQAAYRRVLAVRPHYVPAHVNLGGLLWDTGRRANRYFW
jgi:hypothetical protein